MSFDFFPDPKQTHRLLLDEFEAGAWVDIRQSLTKSDRDFITTGQNVRIEGKAGKSAKEDQTFSIDDVGGFEVERTTRLLERAIVGWSLEITPTRDSFLKLNEDVAIALVNGIEAWYSKSAPERSDSKNGPTPLQTLPEDG